VARSGIAAGESIVVGDDGRDLEAAERAGVAAALVRTGKGRHTEALLGSAAVPAYDDLRELARAILTARLDTGGRRKGG
jgi:phosphoglycolate phosphatase-like HAD superfamily hydrolase